MDKVFGEKIEGAKYYSRVGSYLVAVKNNMLATVKTPKGYFLPGGGIENDESHEECIKRECIEEIGCDVFINSYIGSAEIYGIHERLGYFHPVQYYYSGEIKSKITEPTETNHTFEWISVDDVEDKMFVMSQAWAVKKYLNL